MSAALAIAGAVWVQRRSRQRRFSAASLFGRRQVARANEFVREVGYPLLGFAASQIARRTLNRVLEKVGPLELTDAPRQPRPSPAAESPALHGL